MTRWIIFHDDRNLYFVQLGLGLFWECDTHKERARQFSTRKAAAQMLALTAKNREGWRVITVQV